MGNANETEWPSEPRPLAGTVIDSHTHLDVHDRNLHGVGAPDPRDLLDRAKSVGVDRVVQVGCDVPSSEWAISAAHQYPGVIATVALHPNEAPRRAAAGDLDKAFARIAELAVDPVVRGIGETGLDYFRTDESGREAQHRSFRWHIDLARELNKTLVIHDRDSHEDVISVLCDQGAPDKVVFHCFSGDAHMARVCADNGWYMSFAGVITFKNAEPLRQALDQVPDHLLLVETDAPYLTPTPNRGRVNASYLMPYTVRAIGERRGMPETELCEMLSANTLSAFGNW
jgi:TatD DNase family protein